METFAVAWKHNLWYQEKKDTSSPAVACQAGKRPEQAEYQTIWCRRFGISGSFEYGGYHWIVPCVYACEEGVVIDFCRQIPKDALTGFFARWGEYLKAEDTLTQEQLAVVELENPLNFAVKTKLLISVGLPDGKPGVSEPISLRQQADSSTCWIPQQLNILSKGPKSVEARFLQAYQLPECDGWSFTRVHYSWTETLKQEYLLKQDIASLIDKLEIELKAERAVIPCGLKIQATANQQAVQMSFSNPLTKAPMTLEILRCWNETFSCSGRIKDTKFLKHFDFPSHVQMVAYQVRSKLPEEEYFLKDCSQGDSPVKLDTVNHSASAASIAIIGGADGPTSLFAAGKVTGEDVGEAANTQAKTAASSLYYQEPTEISWRLELQTCLSAEKTVVLYKNT